MKYPVLFPANGELLPQRQIAEIAQKQILPAFALKKNALVLQNSVEEGMFARLPQRPTFGNCLKNGKKSFAFNVVGGAGRKFSFLRHIYSDEFR